VKNYRDSDYALNKHSGGIVYRFADGIVEVTLADYLADNPDKTESDFTALKALSDEDYREQDRIGYRQTWKDVPLDALAETELFAAPSPEAAFIDAPEEAERQRSRAVLAKKAWDKLTEVQRRRYLMCHVEGLTLREIAQIEKTNFKTVYESLSAAEKKIKKILADG
jgi:DNA-directed RNA polymerase specialized sigma24 family protein